MTLELMERYVQSEVENLHLRIDNLIIYVERIDERLSAVERQLSLLYLAIEDLRAEVAHIRQTAVTKEYSKRFATKEDLERFATKEDLERFATKEDLERFATKEDLERFATKEDLNRFVTKADLEELFHRLVQTLRPA